MLELTEAPSAYLSVFNSSVSGSYTAIAGAAVELVNAYPATNYDYNPDPFINVQGDGNCAWADSHNLYGQGKELVLLGAQDCTLTISYRYRPYRSSGTVSSDDLSDEDLAGCVTAVQLKQPGPDAANIGSALTDKTFQIYVVDGKPMSAPRGGSPIGSIEFQKTTDCHTYLDWNTPVEINVVDAVAGIDYSGTELALTLVPAENSHPACSPTRTSRRELGPDNRIAPNGRIFYSLVDVPKSQGQRCAYALGFPELVTTAAGIELRRASVAEVAWDPSAASIVGTYVAEPRPIVELRNALALWHLPAARRNVVVTLAPAADCAARAPEDSPYTLVFAAGLQTAISQLAEFPSQACAWTVSYQNPAADCEVTAQFKDSRGGNIGLADTDGSLQVYVVDRAVKASRTASAVVGAIEFTVSSCATFSEQTTTPVIAAPVANAMVDRPFAVSGTAESGATVEVWVVSQSSSQTLTELVTADASGRWTTPAFEVASLTGSSLLIKAAATASGKNPSDSTDRIVVVEGDRPDIRISFDKPVIEVGETMLVTFRMVEENTGDAEDVTGFRLEHVRKFSDATWTAVDFPETGSVFTANFTASAPGRYELDVRREQFTDLAGNFNDSSRSVITVRPKGTPTVTLHDSSNSGAKDDDYTNDNTPIFAVSDIAMTGAVVVTAAKANAASDDLTVSKKIMVDRSHTRANVEFSGRTCDRDGDGTYQESCQLPDGKWSVKAVLMDADGTELGAASQALGVTIDTTAPTVKVVAVQRSLELEQAATVTFMASEPITGLAADAVLLSTSEVVSLSGFSGTGSHYSISVTGVAAGTATFSVGANTFFDKAGNPNAVASDELEIMVNS